MHKLRRRLAGSALVLALVGSSLAGLTLGCAPAATPRPPTTTPDDPFAVVRATAEAAYQSGSAHLDRGELEAALVDLDTAKTNDADNRQDIQQALDRILSALAAETPTPRPTSVPRTVVVATVPAVLEGTLPAVGAPGVGAASTPGAALTPGAPATLAPPSGETQVTAGVAADATRIAAGATSDATQVAAAATGDATRVAAAATGDARALVVWRDPGGRFSVSAPANWVTDEQSQALFGVGMSVVQFRDPTGRAELDVAVDSASRVVSPELYSAGLEIALQKQVPGYATEQMLPDSTAGNPSIRRTFTFTQRDSAGHDVQARGFQVTIVNASTLYVISASAPADQFGQASPMFDRMVETFRFG